MCCYTELTESSELNKDNQLQLESVFIFQTVLFKMRVSLTPSEIAFGFTLITRSGLTFGILE